MRTRKIKGWLGMVRNLVNSGLAGRRKAGKMLASQGKGRRSTLTRGHIKCDLGFHFQWSRQAFLSSRSMQQTSSSLVSARSLISSSSVLGTDKQPGILPALVARFEEKMPGKQIKIRALEIYNDDLYCLRKGNKLQINELWGTCKFVGGCVYEEVTMATSRTMIEAFIGNRKTAETRANRVSSRSHAIFMIECGGYQFGITDLAGNQRLDSSLYFNETSSINKNILTLGKCIHAFRDGERLPYRESKLTIALMEYFKPYYKIFLITHINRTGKMFYQNINVLDYAAVSFNVKKINPQKSPLIMRGMSKEKKEVVEMKENREREESSEVKSAEYFKEEGKKDMKFSEEQEGNQFVSPGKSKYLWLDKLSAESRMKLKQIFLEEEKLQKENKFKDAVTEMGSSMKKQPNIPSQNGSSLEITIASKLPSNLKSVKDVMRNTPLMIKSSLNVINNFNQMADNLAESLKDIEEQEQPEQNVQNVQQAKPKRPVNFYFRFRIQRAPELAGQINVGKLLKDEWDNIPESIKEAEAAKHKIEMEKYKKDKVLWQQAHPDLKKQSKRKKWEFEGDDSDDGKRKGEKSQGKAAKVVKEKIKSKAQKNQM